VPAGEPLQRPALKVLLGAGAALAVVVLGVAHRTAVDAGGDSLAGADGEWLVLAVLATVAMWLAGAVSLLGTIPVRPPLARLQAPIGAGTVLVVYLGMSSLTAVVPSPGAIGGLDVALVAGLVAAGVSSTVALATVLGYRMITVWLPLPPAACTFAVLLRRRVI
jgi:uncharacterized membrane protein YbhN (UPF0104 family)